MVDTNAQAPAFLELDGPVAIVTLNRPAEYNTINLDMARCLARLMKDIECQKKISVIVVRGAGPAFCGGGDIKYFAENSDGLDDAIRDLLGAYHEFLWTLKHSDKVTIASVHGSAAGAGLSLAAMCDLCIASDQAKFIPAYATLGVSPDGGGTAALAQAVGARRALQIFLTEDGISAEQAEAWGLVTKLVAHETLDDATRAYAARLSRSGSHVLENTKRLIREAPKAELHDHLIDEMESLIRCMNTDLFKDRMTKFLSKSR